MGTFRHTIYIVDINMKTNSNSESTKNTFLNIATSAASSVRTTDYETIKSPHMLSARVGIDAMRAFDGSAFLENFSHDELTVEDTYLDWFDADMKAHTKTDKQKLIIEDTLTGLDEDSNFAPSQSKFAFLGPAVVSAVFVFMVMYVQMILRG